MEECVTGLASERSAARKPSWACHARPHRRARAKLGRHARHCAVLTRDACAARRGVRAARARGRKQYIWGAYHMSLRLRMGAGVCQHQPECCSTSSATSAWTIFLPGLSQMPRRRDATDADAPEAGPGPLSCRARPDLVAKPTCSSKVRPILRRPLENGRLLLCSVPLLLGSASFSACRAVRPPRHRHSVQPCQQLTAQPSPAQP